MSCHRPLTRLIPQFLSCSLQHAAGTRPLVSGPCLVLANSPSTCTTRGSYTLHPVTLRMLPSKGWWPRDMRELPIPCLSLFAARTPLLLDTPDWPSLNMPPSASSLGLLFPSNTRPFSELDLLNSYSHSQGWIEPGQPKVEKRIKWATHFQQLLNKHQLPSLC